MRKIVTTFKLVYTSMFSWIYRLSLLNHRCGSTASVGVKLPANGRILGNHQYYNSNNNTKLEIGTAVYDFRAKRPISVHEQLVFDYV